MVNVNVGSMDRYIRFVLGIILIIAGALTLSSNSTLGIVLLVVSIIPIGTAAINFCPLYAIFGIRTCPVETNNTN